MKTNEPGDGSLPRAARHLPLLLCFVLGACASHEGSYTPACIAFAGDEIRLENGRFVWDKFTDQVLVDGKGEKIDPFPDHPVRGRYRLEQGELVLEPYVQQELPRVYLQSVDGEHYIMTADQFARWRRTGAIDDCALIRGGRRP